MVARFNPCCTRAQLRAVLTGPVTEASDPGLEDHLEHCAVCREELERLAAAPQWWEGAQHYLIDQTAEDDFAFQPTSVNSQAESSASAAERSQIVAHLPPGLLEAAGDPAKIGRIGAYEVVGLIGRGGMGVVLKAFDAALNRYVALKVLAAELAHNASARRRFAREAQAAAAVVHDHVVPIYAVDGSGPIPYLVMACIPGRSLQDRIDQTGPLEVREILRIGMQAAAGLAAAHAQGLVHRDIKPANILLENGVERVRITDFGLARAMDEASQTQSGVLAGTPQYMAPEQAAGEAIDYRTDLFSLGSVLYAMCTGHSPFRAETTVAVLRRICDGAPRPVRQVNPDIPVWLAAIIHKLLSKRPSDRFGSAEEVARLLAEHLAQLQQPLPHKSALRRRFAGWLAAGTAVVSATVWLGFLAAGALKDNEQTKQAPAIAEQTSASPGASASSGSRPATFIKPARIPATPADVDPFLAELEKIKQDLDRLERSPPASNGHWPRNDPLRQIDAGLDAIEREISVSAPPRRSASQSISHSRSQSAARSGTHAEDE